MDLPRRVGRLPAGCWLLLLFPVFGLLLAAVALLGPWRGDVPPDDAAPIIVDRIAPDFTAQTPGGQTVRLADVQGKLVALNFWATWCEPCRTEMPALQSASVRHPELLVLGIDAGEPVDSVQAYTHALGLTFTVLLDPTGDIRNRYGVRVFPTTVWVDAAGKVRVKQLGPLTPDLIERYVSSLLAPSASP
jgi:cytochrome c biogenesis protein CcmG/thiol:disulfide interchange protein DsbE